MTVQGFARFAAACAVVRVLLTSAQAQMFVDAANTPVVENFNAGIVMNSGASESAANGRKIVIGGFSVPRFIEWTEAETNVMNNVWTGHPVWNTNPRYVLDSRYAASSMWIEWLTPHETQDPPSATRPFTRNYNNDGDSQDSIHVGQEGNRLGVIDGTILPALGTGNYALYVQPNMFADTELTLRFVNRTGAAVTKWRISADAWANDVGKGNVTFALLAGTSYSTWSSGLTTAASTTSGNSNAGWVSKGTLTGTVNLTVAKGASLYVQMRQTRVNPSASNNGFVFDNLSVTAVVDPPSGGTVLLVK